MGKGYLSSFFEGGDVEIEVTGENPPDIAALVQAEPVIQMSCASGSGAAMTTTFKPVP